MRIYLTAPGQRRVPISLPTNATFADFARKAFELTGLSVFNGFGYLNEGTGYTVPLASDANSLSGFTAPLRETPVGPTVTPTTGTGSLAAGTYYAVLTYVGQVGESLASAQTTVTLSAVGEITVTSPAAAIDAFTNVVGYNVYIGTVNGSGWTKQNTSGYLPIGTNFTQSVALNTTSTTPPVITTVSFTNATPTTLLSSILASESEFVIPNTNL